MVFDDVPEALEEWQARGIKTYIYSSGSREAQKLIFGNTNFGDLRVFLSGFFDTTIGYVGLPPHIILEHLPFHCIHSRVKSPLCTILLRSSASKKDGALIKELGAKILSEMIRRCLYDVPCHITCLAAQLVDLWITGTRES